MIGLNKTATIYTPSVATGAYTVVDKTGLKVRLAVIQTAAASIDGERENIGSNKRLLFDPTYTMPADAQALIGSDRWNIREGSTTAVTGPDDITIIYNRCEVTRAL